MRTLVVSDLHLGAHHGADILQRRGPREALVRAAEAADRLVLLGDVLEMRHGPARDALAAALPVLAELAEAAGEVVLVAGNHDHALVAPWLTGRASRAVPPPLRLEEDPGRGASPLVERIAAAVAPGRLTVRYPGVWLREDVYATHGHYLDRLFTVPTFERLGAGAMGRIVGPVPVHGATPDDFEAALGPLYAWMHAVAETPAKSWAARRQGASAALWERLAGSGPRRLRVRAMAALVPAAVHGLNRAGLGPLHPDLSGDELRRAGLRAMGEVVRRLGVGAPHVVFGHTHRAGPLPGDDPAEWRVGATRLHNPGCWVREPSFARGGVESPYWAGRAIVVEGDSPPRLVRLVADLG